MATETTENLIIGIDFDKKEFPVRFTCDGENISPALHIRRIHAPYLAVIVEDRIGPNRLFNHWLMWDIPATEEIPENIPREKVLSHPFSAVQGRSDANTIGYYGPCPPRGEIHSYFFNIYGLSSKLDLSPGADRAALDKAMKGKMIQYGGQAIATYQRR